MGVAFAIGEKFPEHNSESACDYREPQVPGSGRTILWVNVKTCFISISEEVAHLPQDILNSSNDLILVCCELVALRSSTWKN